MNEHQQKNELKKFRELVENIKTGILITKSEADELKGRPMSTSHVDDNGDIWFFTNEFSTKVEEISRNNEVFITYAENSDENYAVVTGTAYLNRDQTKIKELWNSIFEEWFPEGLKDPQLALLKVVPDEVEYWTESSSKVVILFKMLSSMIKGETNHDVKHSKMKMNHY